jgi:cystathionine gamma-synthase
MVYRRPHQTTQHRLEAILGELEGGRALVYPSGLSAVSSLIRYLAPKRIAIADAYHGTLGFVAQEAARGAWEIVEPSELEAGDLMWLETPSNPKLQITDIAVAVEAAADGVIVAADGTFATPILQKPLSLGADFVVHSTTKAIAGHSDALGGVIVSANPAHAHDLSRRRTLDGAVGGSLDLWLTLRGIRTLPLRVDRASDTAVQIAQWLVDRVPTTHYPFLDSHPGTDVARRQMKSGGTIVSFEMGSFDEASRVMAGLRLFRHATSLGGVESLAEHRRLVNPNAPEGLIRLSIGLEAPADLISDLEQALQAGIR